MKTCYLIKLAIEGESAESVLQLWWYALATNSLLSPLSCLYTHTDLGMGIAI